MYGNNATRDSAMPFFDSTNPTANGWYIVDDISTVAANISFLVFTLPDNVCQADGNIVWNLTMQARDPATTDKLPAGIILGQAAHVVSNETDNDMTNNTATATTKTIGMDLTVSLTGSTEGLSPGIVPGSDLQYTITMHSQGTELACANWVDVTLASGVIPTTPFLITEKPILTTHLGQESYFVDTTENRINSPTISVTDKGNNTWRFGFGDTNICLPAMSQVSWTIGTTVASDIATQTSLTTTANVGTNGPAIEDELSNNTTSTMVMVYRPDITVTKHGYSYGTNKTDNNGTGDDTTLSTSR